MLLQAIVIPDQRYDRYRRSVDFIQKYVFPGGCLPSAGAICHSLGRPRRLQLAPGRHHATLRPDAVAVAGAILRQHRPGARTGILEEFIRTWGITSACAKRPSGNGPSATYRWCSPGPPCRQAPDSAAPVSVAGSGHVSDSADRCGENRTHTISTTVTSHGQFLTVARFVRSYVA